MKMKKEQIKKKVRERYAGAAKTGASCCGPSPCGCSETGTLEKSAGLQVGYTPEDLAKVPGESNLGLGCGNPTAVAGLKEGDRIVALLSQPSETEASDGLTTSIPADTTLRAEPVLDEEASELVIDLSSEFLSIEGPELPKAFAQIVWTVSEMPGVRQVRFLVDGEEIRAQNAAGAEQEGAVTRADYIALAPR